MASLILRGSTYYIQHMVSGKAKRVSTGTESLQIATEKLRQFESAQARGDALPLPTRTAIPEVLSAYVSHARAIKTAKSARTRQREDETSRHRDDCRKNTPLRQEVSRFIVAIRR